MKIITLYAEQQEVNYFSCVVTNKTFDKLTELSTIGGFKRFGIDYEDDTKKRATSTTKIVDTFLSKVFTNVPKESILK